jgi:heme exporter protein D
MKVQFDTFDAFVSMGGHAGFVFGAWGLATIIIAALIVRAVKSGAMQKARLRAFEDDAIK